MRDWRAYTGKELFELTTNLDATIERQGQKIVKQAEELHDHERVMKMLRDRFPIREDGSHSDYAVEDVLTENTRQQEQIQRMEANRIKLVRNLAQACGALLEIADYADKEPFDMRDLKLIAIASDCLGVK